MVLQGSPYDAVRQRRSSERPFAGHTIESLKRKLASDSLRIEVKEQIQTELQWRARNEL